MNEDKVQVGAAQEREIAAAASGEQTKKAWSECSALVAKLGGGVKALWSRIHPDRSPEAMLSALNANLAGNKSQLRELKPELDGVYREIVAKKKDYQSAPPARQRILKMELQTLMARYRSLEREFSILSENERSIEQVKGRFLEVLAYGKRGDLDEAMVERLTDDIDDKADEAEDIQDALGDLERAGKRTDRTSDNFDDELAGFDMPVEDVSVSGSDPRPGEPVLPGAADEVSSATPSERADVRARENVRRDSRAESGDVDVG